MVVSLVFCYNNYISSVVICEDTLLTTRGIFLVNMYTKSWHVNDYVDCGEYYEMIIRNNKYIEIARTKIDKSVYKKVLPIKWHIRDIKEKQLRVVASVKNIMLHQFILGKRVGFVIDHKNGDGLDNRKVNLRHATIWQNNVNKIARGTEYHKDVKKWRAYVQIHGKNIYHGWFNNENEAKNERIKMIKKYFGEFARV